MTPNTRASGRRESQTTELMSSIRGREAVPGRAACAPMLWSVCKVIFVSWQPITRSKRRTIRLIAIEFNRKNLVELSVDHSGFVIGPADDVYFAIGIQRDTDVDRPAAHETVFDVLLIVDRVVNDYFDAFATIRTVNRFSGQHW